MKDLIIFGASGFGREVAWVVERINAHTPTWNLIGFMDDDEKTQGIFRSIEGNAMLILRDLAYPNKDYAANLRSSLKNRKPLYFLKYKG